MGGSGMGKGDGMRQRAALLVAGVLVLWAAGQVAAQPQGCGTALLVIDVQNICVANSTAAELTTADGAQLVDQLVTVLAAARAAAIPIVYIQYLPAGYAIGDPYLDTVSAIAPLPGDPIVWKTAADSFKNTTLTGVLGELGAHRLLLTGQATDVCVFDTALGAVRSGYETWVVSDAHAGVRTSGELAYYNSMWPTLGVSVIDSEQIEFAAYGCAAASSP
jgi:nicotinamidase-related amidase